MTTPTFPPCPFDAAIRAGEPLPSLSIRHEVPPRGHSVFHDEYRAALASGIVAHADCVAQAVRKASAKMIRTAFLQAEIAERLRVQAYDALAQLQRETRGAHNNATAIADIIAELELAEGPGPDTIPTIASIIRQAGHPVLGPCGCGRCPGCIAADPFEP